MARLASLPIILCPVPRLKLTLVEFQIGILAFDARWWKERKGGLKMYGTVEKVPKVVSKVVSLNLLKASVSLVISWKSCSQNFGYALGFGTGLGGVATSAVAARMMPNS
eukprot:5562937-Amphidinium_carterae.1